MTHLSLQSWLLLGLLASGCNDDTGRSVRSDAGGDSVPDDGSTSALDAAEDENVEADERDAESDRRDADAPRDANGSDGTAPDAEEADAMQPAGGSAEAGSSDAGLEDSGSRDGGPGDAGSADAGDAGSGAGDGGSGDGGSGDVWALCDAIYELRAHDPGDPSRGLTVQPNSNTVSKVSFDPPWGAEPSQAIAFRPLTDNAAVLRDWLLYGAQKLLASRTVDPGGAALYPGDVGVVLPSAASSLSLELEYDARGQTSAVRDRSGVAVCVVQGEHLRPKHADVSLQLAAAGPGGTMVPSNSAGYRLTRSCRVLSSEPVYLLTALPHARSLAVAVRFSVTRANGTEFTLFDGPYAWTDRRTHVLPANTSVERGDTITTTCVYDNPTNMNVVFGDRGITEMCFNFATYYPAGALDCRP